MIFCKEFVELIFSIVLSVSGLSKRLIVWCGVSVFSLFAVLPSSSVRAMGVSVWWELVASVVSPNRRIRYLLSFYLQTLFYYHLRPGNVLLPI